MQAELMLMDQELANLPWALVLFPVWLSEDLFRRSVAFWESRFDRPWLPFDWPEDVVRWRGMIGWEP